MGGSTIALLSMGIMESYPDDEGAGGTIGLMMLDTGMRGGSLDAYTTLLDVGAGGSTIGLKTLVAGRGASSVDDRYTGSLEVGAGGSTIGLRTLVTGRGGSVDDGYTGSLDTGAGWSMIGLRTLVTGRGAASLDDGYTGSLEVGAGGSSTGLKMLLIGGRGVSALDEGATTLEDGVGSLVDGEPSTGLRMPLSKPSVDEVGVTELEGGSAGLGLPRRESRRPAVVLEASAAGVTDVGSRAVTETESAGDGDGDGAGEGDGSGVGDAAGGEEESEGWPRTSEVVIRGCCST